MEFTAAPYLTVVVCSHNPQLARLNKVLDALNAQTLSRELWEAIIVDNASIDSIAVSKPWINIVREPRLGLAYARLSGVKHARGELIIFVDDDNLLASDFLANALQIARAYQTVGAFGGKISAFWEENAARPDWLEEFQSNLALRDFGQNILIESAAPLPTYPVYAPVGAGMVLRKSALSSWLATMEGNDTIADRSGTSLTSGGDNDIVLHVLRAGFDVGYFPNLRLVHSIPAERLTVEYHARLAHGIMRSWVDVLSRHGIQPWKHVPQWTVGLRKVRAFIQTRAWRSPKQYIQWRQRCGLIEGRAKLSRKFDRLE